MIRKLKMMNRQNFDELLRYLYRSLSSEMEKFAGISLDQRKLPYYELRDLEQKLNSMNDPTEILEILKQFGYESMIQKGKRILNLDLVSRECLDAIWSKISESHQK